jgi:hypothetical protein
MKVTELTYCLGIAEEITLLDYSWSGCGLLLSEDRRAKLIANPTRVTTARIFIISSRRVRIVCRLTTGIFQQRYVKQSTKMSP